jgi:hypothetical protein
MADAFRVGHDAGDQNARLRRIEIADRQPRDVRLDPPPHLRDGPLRGHAEHLREREGRHRPHERREAGHQSERHQHLGPLLPDDVVDEEFGGCRQDEPRDAIDEHEDQAESKAPSPCPHQFARLPPGFRRVEFLVRGPCRRRASLTGMPAVRTLRPRKTDSADTYGHISL